MGPFEFGGEEGIRTLDTLPYTHFPGVLLQPLGHLSKLFIGTLSDLMRGSAYTLVAPGVLLQPLGHLAGNDRGATGPRGREG